LKPKDELDNSLLVEIQQIQEMVDSAGTDENCGLQAKQVQMVAGAKRHLNLTPDYGKVQLVAGAHSRRSLASDSENKASMVAGARSHRYLADGNPSKTAISKGTANIFVPLYAVFGLGRVPQNKVQRSAS
jgi:hypothetical protein